MEHERNTVYCVQRWSEAMNLEGGLGKFRGIFLGFKAHSSSASSVV